MALSQRTVRLLIVVGIVLGLVAVPLVVYALVGAAPVTGTIPLNATDGPEVQITFDSQSELDLREPFPDSSTVEITSEHGNATISGVSDQRLDIHQDDISGTYTEATGITTGGEELTIDPEDKPAITVEGDLDRVMFREAQLDDGQIDFEVEGDSGSSNVTVRGLAADTIVIARNVSSGDAVDTATTDGSGTAAFEVSHSTTSVSLESTDPEVSVGNLDPSGNLSSPPNTLSAEVRNANHPDINTTVEFYWNGNLVDTKKVNSDGKVSTSASFTVNSGLNDYRVEVEDDFGETDTAETQVGVPNEFRIENESNPDELIDDETVEVTFYDREGDVIYEENTTDGTIDMTGFEVSQYIVDVSAANHTERTVYIESIIDQQTAYLLPDDRETRTVRFELDDVTGDWGSETVLYISRAMNVSGELQFQTVYADEFGSEGVTADLQNDTRYNLRIKNSEGRIQDLDSYRPKVDETTASIDETVILQPGAPGVEIDDYEAGWGTAAEIEDKAADDEDPDWRMEVVYDDPDNSTDNVKLWIHERGNTSNQLVPNQTYFDLGLLERQISMTENESEKVWVVNYIVERNGQTFTTQEQVTGTGNLVLPGLDTEWRLIIGLSILFMFAGVFSVLNRAVGAIAVAVVGGIMWWTGWLVGATAGAAVILYLFIAVLYNIYASGGGY